MRAASDAARYDPVMRARHHVRRGRVTWANVLIVCGMALLAVGVLAAMVGKVRAAAERSVCINNVFQIASAAQAYRDNKGTFPAGTMPNSELPPERRLSWMMEIQPYLEAGTTYSDTDKTLAWDAERNKPTTHTHWRTFVCPAALDRNTIRTSYVGIAGVGGMETPTLGAEDRRAGVFGFDRATRQNEVKDGLANTVMILETTIGGPWAQGGMATVGWFDPTERPHVGAGRVFGGRHIWQQQTFSRNVGAYGAMADGSYRFLRDDMASEILEALATIHGGETLPPDW
jgi:hypothetical protein